MSVQYIANRHAQPGYALPKRCKDVSNLQTANISNLLAQAMRHETNRDFEAACKVMLTANIHRPQNAFILGKLIRYQSTIKKMIHLQKLVKTGELAIVPIGFRCFTKATLEAALSFRQPSLPFDVGFFPPQSLVSILKSGDMRFPASSSGQLLHEVCRKFDNHTCPANGVGIHFETSTYQEVNSQVAKAPPNPDIGQWLDDTRAYYTLNTKHGYILAHYNWHESAPAFANSDMPDHLTQMQLINDIFTRRMERFLQACHNAKLIIFVYGETQGHNYMSIDDTAFDLTDISDLSSVTQERFQTPSTTVKLLDVANWGKVLDIAERVCPDILVDAGQENRVA